MNVSIHTKISALIKENPASIDVIASINKHFEKLRNPILRKLLASRITIADAAKIGGCTVNDFFVKLLPLGFELAPNIIQEEIKFIPAAKPPDFMQKLNAGNITTLDVRADLASGDDPFKKIMELLSSMPQENALLIINNFEPVPLINILKRKGFIHYTEICENGTSYTYLKSTDKTNMNEMGSIAFSSNSASDFARKKEEYIGKIVEIDVRKLEMPLPMIAILRELELLPEGFALFVKHKKIPQFLLPELEEKKFIWLIDEVGEGDVKLLVFR